MHELLAWLRSENGGVRTYIELQQRALVLRASEPESAAFARMLADLSGRFVAAYYEDPLPVDVARTALEQIIIYVERALQVQGVNDNLYIKLLNEIGVSDLSQVNR